VSTTSDRQILFAGTPRSAAVRARPRAVVWQSAAVANGVMVGAGPIGAAP
jgi:hypothetical protein